MSVYSELSACTVDYYIPCMPSTEVFCLYTPPMLPTITTIHTSTHHHPHPPPQPWITSLVNFFGTALEFTLNRSWNIYVCHSWFINHEKFHMLIMKSSWINHEQQISHWFMGSVLELLMCYSSQTTVKKFMMFYSWTFNFLRGLFLSCSWTIVPFVVHGQFMNNSWNVHGQSMDNSWTIPGTWT